MAGAALAATLSLAVAAAALRLWSWHPSVPLSYSTDALSYDLVVKGTIDHGWYLHNPDLGAPFGADGHDFPFVSNDSLQLLIVKVLGLFTGRPFLVTNAFFLLTFPLNAVGAFLALRWRRAPRELAVLGGALFGILPLSFVKGIDYLFFVSAYMVPIGAALALTVLAGEPLVRRRPEDRGLRAWATPRNAGLLVLCAAIASASLYHAAFTVILLVGAALGRGVTSRSRRALAEGFGLVGAIVFFGILNQLPTVLYRMRHGSNPIVAVRDPAEAEYYGLKLMDVVLPIPGHRIGPLADLTDRYHSTTKILGEPSTSIGLTATIGLAWLLALALGSILASRRSRAGSDEERNAAFLVVLAFIVATVGGVATIVSYTVSPQLRGWSRISVFLAFFGLVGTVGLLERARRRLTGRGGHAAFAAGLAGLFVVAGLDQTSSRLAPPHAAIEREHEADADFVARLESLLPARSMVLQLPYVAYPEVPATHRLGVYDELRPYLHSKDLRWSYGAMKGRPEDWHADLSAAPLRSLLAGAVAGGFAGLVVDRFGYRDEAAALEAELASLLGAPAVVGATDRLAFWDLRPLDRRLRDAGAPMDRLADQALRPLRLSFGDGFYAEEAGPGSRWRWSREEGAVTIENPASEPREAIFGAEVRTAVPGSGTTTLHLPDGSTETVTDAGSDGVTVRRRVLVPPGRSTLRITSTARPLVEEPPGRRRLVARLVDPVLLPLDLCQAAEALGAADGDCLVTPLVHRP